MKTFGLIAYIILFSFSAEAVVQQQLNIEGFASCLAQKLPNLNLRTAVVKNSLYPGDLLLPYLAVYAGKRLPLIGKIAQDRWSKNYAKEEENLAIRLYNRALTTNSLLPNEIYAEALSVCGFNDAFCAGLISHNVLRTLGRSYTAVSINSFTKSISDFNPDWFRKYRQIWLSRATKIQQALISLHRNATDDKWGDNYHFFGLFTFSLHEKALYYNVSSAWLVARMNQVLNPILAGGAESPEKARIDRDSVEVVSEYFRQGVKPKNFNCSDASAYRLSAP